MDTVFLSPEVLTWAAERNGESWRSVVEILASGDRDRERIGNGALTIPQIEKLAKHTHVPFGYLFLSSPPKLDSTVIPDLRQTTAPEPLDRNFYDQLDIVTARQDWFRAYQRKQGAEPLSFVGRFSVPKTRDVNKIAGEIRAALRLTVADRKGNAENYYSTLVSRVESTGVLVMKSGVVGASTRRKLSAEQFRGFALVDDLAPVIFINGNDHEAAFSFTLIHELAHIWMGEPGVSDASVSKQGATIGSSGVEQLCNAVAGEVLVPSEELNARWHIQSDIDVQANFFRVSRLTIARRVLALDLISWDRYQQIALQSKRGAKNNEGGGNPYATIPIRASKRLTLSLVVDSLSQRTLLLDAARLLGCKVSTLISLSQKLGYTN
jgi:Zn-dependent peptidase ImmA (M78 family)